MPTIILSAAAITLIGAVSIAVSTQASAPGAMPGLTPVAVELFTSQGCSSCPPADALLERLSREPGIVAITRSVTYWDRLGWKDTLARPANTNLQRAYSARKLPGGGVYTPEIVVQGRYGAVGSDERRIRSLIGQARNSKGPAINLANHIITIAGGSGHASIELLRLMPAKKVAVGSGENGGRNIRYIHIMQSEQLLGTWTGGSKDIALPKDALSAGRAAILVREGKAGPILAARLL